MSALLQLRRISKSFRGLRAVADVSLDIETNAIVALIGPNGAGKTTLFNMIAGTLAPDIGEICFDGVRVDGWRADQLCAAGLGRTFQLVKPFPGMSVLDNVVVGALQRAAGVAQARERAGMILDLLGLGTKRALPAGALTLPDRKRLEIARALATRPKCLLLDEVMAGLRPAECDEMVTILRDLQGREGMTIFLIEHVLRPVMALAQTIVVMHHGEIIARGDPAEVVRDPTVLECYLGEDGEV